jgi:hypothetical protein
MVWNLALCRATCYIFILEWIQSYLYNIGRRLQYTRKKREHVPITILSHNALAFYSVRQSNQKTRAIKVVISYGNIPFLPTKTSHNLVFHFTLTYLFITFSFLSFSFPHLVLLPMVRGDAWGATDHIEDNRTWELTNLLVGHRTIGLKWVYKVKCNESGDIVRHKTHLVAKCMCNAPASTMMRCSLRWLAWSQCRWWWP